MQCIKIYFPCKNKRKIRALSSTEIVDLTIMPVDSIATIQDVNDAVGQAIFGNINIAARFANLPNQLINLQNTLNQINGRLDDIEHMWMHYVIALIMYKRTYSAVDQLKMHIF
jgi:hypothetical protein